MSNKIENTLRAMLATKLPSANVEFVDQSFHSLIHCQSIQIDVIDSEYAAELKTAMRNLKITEDERIAAKFKYKKFVDECIRESSVDFNKHNLMFKYKILKWDAPQNYIVPSTKSWQGEKVPLTVLNEFQISLKTMQLALEYDLLETSELTDNQHDVYKIDKGSGWKFKCKGILYDLSNNQYDKSTGAVWKRGDLYLRLTRLTDYVSTTKLHSAASYIDSLLKQNDIIQGSK